jgi:DNA-binding GntR family transcriptional regulator
MRTSTTPVREALRELAGEGLVDLDAHRGVIVHRGQLHEFEEIYRLRMLLEPLAGAATVQHITLEDLAAAEQIVGLMERERSVAEWTILNGRFHSLLAEASRLPILTSILLKLRNMSALYIAQSLIPHPDRIRVANVEHRAILQAAKERNVEGAQRAELGHLRHTYEIVAGRSTADPALAAAWPESITDATATIDSAPQ